MKRAFLCCFLVSLLDVSSVQAQKLSYGQYKEYALGGYLNTALSNIRVAGAEWQNGDTSLAIQHI
jgi:hypothetical protein